MPISKENRHRYPPEWEAISLARRQAAGWRCEWCGAAQGKPHPVTGTKVVLTVAHLDHTPENVSPSNLRCLCWRCHLGYDRRERLSRGDGPAQVGASAGHAALRRPNHTIGRKKRVEYDPITVNDPTGEAFRQCEMGRKEMMIRELLMNAVERVQRLPAAEQQIRLYGATNHPYPVEKLAIWNRGGMDLRTMKRFSDINAAIDKGRENFGRGGKIASMMSNRLGLRFRSCHAGRVLEVTLAVHPEERQIVRLVPEHGIGEVPDYIRDVTEEYKERGAADDFCNLACDWTEVVLMGNEPDQDTTRVPYLDEEVPQSHWLFSGMGYRFFRLPAEVRIGVHSKITRHRGSGGNDGKPYWVRFYTMSHSLPYAAEYTAVPFEGGTIHYLRPRDGEARGGNDAVRGSERIFGTEYANQGGFGGLLWRDEIYQLHVGTGRGKGTRPVLGSRPYPTLALRWGLVRAYKEVAILVELADGEAVPDINRTTLLSPTGRELHPNDFDEVVQGNMPAWVRDLERKLAPKEDEQSRSLHDAVQHMIAELMANYLGLHLEGDEVAVEDPPASPPPGPPGPPRPRPEPGDPPSPKPGGDERKASRKRRLLGVPDFHWVDQSWFDEHDLPGMAGLFQPPTPDGVSKLYFNEEHIGFSRLLDSIAGTLGTQEDLLRYEVARPAAKHVITLAVCKYVAAGLALIALNISIEEALRGLEPVVITAAFNAAFTSPFYKSQCQEAAREFKSRLLAYGTGEPLGVEALEPLGVNDGR